MTSATRTFDQGHFRAAPCAPNKTARRLEKKSEAPTLFFVCSFVMHAGLLVVFSSLPEPAHAKAISVQEIEVTVVPDAPTAAPPEEPEALPLGTLAEESIDRLTPKPHLTRLVPASRPAALTDSIPPSAAPAVLTSNNPYDRSNLGVFTSGNTSTTNSRTVVSTPVPHSSSSFGVQSGSEDFSEQEAKALEAWRNQVRAQLASLASRSYPKRAQRQKQEGTTKIFVQIDSSGRVVSAKVHKGSGHSILDRAALGGVQSLGNVLAPPAGTGTARLTIPVTYRLR